VQIAGIACAGCGERKIANRNVSWSLRYIRRHMYVIFLYRIFLYLLAAPWEITRVAIERSLNVSFSFAESRKSPTCIRTAMHFPPKWINLPRRSRQIESPAIKFCHIFPRRALQRTSIIKYDLNQSRDSTLEIPYRSSLRVIHNALRVSSPLILAYLQSTRARSRTRNEARE